MPNFIDLVLTACMQNLCWEFKTSQWKLINDYQDTIITMPFWALKHFKLLPSIALNLILTKKTYSFSNFTTAVKEEAKIFEQTIVQ